MPASRRVAVLEKQMRGEDDAGSSLRREPCSASPALLENVDAGIMETFLDDQRDLKRDVYAAFAKRPDLLVPTVEQLNKEEHRELVRNSLAAVLDAGHKPLEYFDSDIKKYIYMAEVCAPIDLSLVRTQQASSCHLSTLRRRAQ